MAELQLSTAPQPLPPIPPQPNPSVMRLILSVGCIIIALCLAYWAIAGTLPTLITDNAMSKTGATETSFSLSWPLLLLSQVSSLIAWIFAYSGVKRFRFKDNPLGVKAKIFLSLFTIFVVVLPLVLNGIGIVRTLTASDGYAQARQQVNFHLYRPTNLPNDLIIISKYSAGAELIPGDFSAVRFAIGKSLKDSYESQSTTPIVVTQAGIDANFDTDAFASTFMSEVTPQAITVATAKNQSGFLYERPFGTATLTFLLFETNDNVLISIGSPRVGKDQLLEIAEYLE